MQINWTRAVTAGVVGTLVMTGVGVFVAPMMGMPPMNPASMLATQMGGSILMGWIAHLMIGVILAIGYAIVAGKLPGPAPVRGALYGLAPWLMAMLVVMPMMGMGVFAGWMGSLIGHMVYGAVVGTVYGTGVVPD
jgi:uncharacterized membrane protein YagU involved in acid resistance